MINFRQKLESFNSLTKDQQVTLGVLCLLVISLPLLIIASLAQTHFAPKANEATLSNASLITPPFSIPVLSIKYFPLDPSDSSKLDRNIVGTDLNDLSLSSIRNKVHTVQNETVDALTKGSAYHLYKDTNTVPNLNYSIYEEKEFLKPIPLIDGGSGSLPANHVKVLKEEGFDICDYVDNKGIKEVWIWMYHSNVAYPVESFQAGPWGSFGNGVMSLPYCNKTYTVYDYNYGAGVGNTLEDHGHHLEKVFPSVNANLWKNQFMGIEEVPVESYHCGWMHCPPNVMSVCSSHGYNWFDETTVLSDCENWKADGTGLKTLANCHTWAGATCGQDAGDKFKVWWMQNIPQGWWVYIGNYDEARRLNIGLNEFPVSLITSIRINSGGLQFRDNSGNLWSADQEYSGSVKWGYINSQASTQSYAVTVPIAKTVDDFLYQNERYADGNWRYRFDVINGFYEVVLKFAEIYYKNCDKNLRKFNVKIQGLQVLTNFDTFFESGCQSSIDKTFYTTVTNGKLIVDFLKINGFDTPKINAIQVNLLSQGNTPTITPVVTTTLTPTVTPTIIPTATPSVNPSFVVYRVNTGGPAFTDKNGLNFLADKPYAVNSWGYIGVNTNTYANPSAAILNSKSIVPADKTLYLTERYSNSNFNYRFDVPNGKYRVTLKFAEIYPRSCTEGVRVFNVKIENLPVLTNFDVFKSSLSKCYGSVDKIFETDVVDGNLVVSFIPVVDSSAIKGIIIKKI